MEVDVDNEEVIQLQSTPANIDGSFPLYQLHLQNIPKFFRNVQVKSNLSKLGIQPKKLTVLSEHAYVSFNNESDCNNALKLLNESKWKNRALRARLVTGEMARASEQKSSQSDDNNVSNKRKRPFPDNEEVVSDPRMAILQAVTPLCGLSYVEQLHRKQMEIRRILCNCSLEIRKGNDDLPFLPRNSHYGNLDNIREAPSVTAYRNKCEFTIGYSDNRKATVGFRLAKYKEGSSVVLPPYDCSHLPLVMNQIVKAMQTFLDLVCSDTSFLPYDVVTRTGFWRQLTVRSFVFDNLVIVVVNPQNTESQEILRVKKLLAGWLLYGKHPFKEQEIVEHDFRVSSLLYQELVNLSDPVSYELLGGCPYVYENLQSRFGNHQPRQLRFRVSAGSFFQTNTAGAELLYTTIAEICQESCDPSKTLLLDICCGTGTIGIFLAPLVAKVIGIELDEEAVQDAKMNAECNRVNEMCSFMAGKAEEVFVTLVKTGIIKDSASGEQHVIGVLDPPRAGLQDKIIIAIRKLSSLKQLIYVSCDPKAASKNFVDLCRKESKKYQGSPFVLKRAIPVDMFPQTTHCELVLLFER